MRSAIVYSGNPKDKTDLKVRKAVPNYHGKIILCAKCKTMPTIIEKGVAA